MTGLQTKTIHMDWSPLSELIRTYQRFVITTHVKPDGDALGSELGMVGLLKHFGKETRVLNVSLTPPRYNFLTPDVGLFQHYDPADQFTAGGDDEVLVILDLSSWSQLGGMQEFVLQFQGPKLVIDHHVSEDDLGATMLKDVQAESTGSLVLRASRALGVPISTEMATALFTAIAMDTGWFRHKNVRPATFRDLAELVEAGAEPNRIHRLLFEQNSIGRIQLVSSVLGSLALELDGRVAVGTVTREVFEATGAQPSETEDLIDHLASIVGVEVAILFVEQLNGDIKLSLRSRGDLNVAALASQFGGGGHRVAAGATLREPLEVARNEVLGALGKAMEVSSP